MNIIVLVKQVPDTQNITGEAMTPEGTVNRAVLPAIFNPDDLYALEAALHIKDKNPGTKVNVVTMGPPAAAAVLSRTPAICSRVPAPPEAITGTGTAFIIRRVSSRS
jgi:electron transfer flavoprotein alpha/beta subunit